jgi:response regulator RpfG family c-di-GMP phosphodiesterase/signal transduction histidine kinase
VGKSLTVEKYNADSSKYTEPIQRGFSTETLDKAIGDVRLTTIVASIAFALFNIVDYIAYRDIYFLLTILRIGVIVLNLIIFAIMHTELGKRYPLHFSMLEYLICGLSIVSMVHLSGGYASPYYAGINLVMLAFIFLLPLDARLTAIICLILYAAYIIPIVAMQKIERRDVFFNNNFFLLATCIVVIISAYISNQMRFREFSGRYNLAQANEELKKLDTLKSQFFANVSHEVRTPLTSILAPVQSLFQGDVGEVSPEHKHLIGQVYRNALKLLDMINQMLDFSKFEAGRMQLRLRPMYLDELVRDTVSIFQDVTERKGLKLQYIQQEELPAIYLDPDKVERILTNLIRNAIKFTETGSITVRTGTEPGIQFFEVRDTGIGIPSEHLANIFKRFQQVDGSSTRKYEGTGLGLTIAKEATDLLRGNISVHSEERRGSTFRVDFPGNLEQVIPEALTERRVQERRRTSFDYDGDDRRRQHRRQEDLARIDTDDLALIEKEILEVKDHETESVPSASGQRIGKVVLVEDNFDLRAYISKMLSRFGHEVSTAVDGLDGWEQVQNNLPDVVVTDIMMPRMDGYELLSKIKTSEKTRGIPVILITAKPELESKLQGLQIGADDYLPKPVNIRELDARIKNLITTRNFQLSLARETELNTRMEELSMSFSQSLEIRDFNTAGHSRDVLNLGSIIAEGLGIPMDRQLRDSLLLHDIGKLGIPDRVLLKESPLTSEEWEIMKKHPELGANLLGHFETYKAISAVILAHQEHIDGTGYPNGLKGEQIPLFSRIIAIADAYHAMTSNRPYRKALTPTEAVSELIKHRGTQFDSRLVEVFAKGLIKRRILPGIVIPPESGKHG